MVGTETGIAFQFEFQHSSELGTVFQLQFQLGPGTGTVFSSGMGIGQQLELFFSSSSKLDLSQNCFSVQVPIWNCFTFRNQRFKARFSSNPLFRVPQTSMSVDDPYLRNFARETIPLRTLIINALTKYWSQYMVQNYISSLFSPEILLFQLKISNFFTWRDF